MENNIRKIVMTEDIYMKSLQEHITVDEVLEREYKEEINKFVTDNPSAKGLTPIQLSMAQHGISNKSILNSFNTNGAGEWLMPSYIDTLLRENINRKPILQYITNTTVGVDGLAAMSATLNLNDEKNKDNISRKRVAEGQDIPLAKIELGESVIKMVKRGRAIEATYEALMYLRINVFNKYLDAIANDIAQSQVDDAIDVLINGDGNKDKKIETMTLSTAGTVTDVDLLNMAMKFTKKSGFPITTLIVGDKFYQQIIKMRYNTNEASGVLSMFGFEFPQSIFENVTVIYNDNIPKANGKEQIIALNVDQSLIKYVALGSNIKELQSNIRNQTQLGTFTEIANFGLFNPDTVLIGIEK